jgi:hypothetical protein
VVDGGGGGCQGSIIRAGKALYLSNSNSFNARTDLTVHRSTGRRQSTLVVHGTTHEYVLIHIYFDPQMTVLIGLRSQWSLQVVRAVLASPQGTVH